MRGLSRRDFFRQFLPPLIRDSVNPKREETVVLGQIRDFPVNSSTVISIRNQDICLESICEGFRAILMDSGRFVRLSMGVEGRIYAHLTEFWSENMVLSILTGDAYFIEKEES